MGGVQSQNQQTFQELLSDFTELRKESNGVVLSDKKGENTFFLKEFSYANKHEFDTEFARLQTLESSNQNENVLGLVRLFSQTYNNICSNSYKIYALYEYPSITLEQEIGARRKENKYFDECELWSILQSCANAIGQLKPTLSLHPKNVYIVPDGVLKVVNNQMIDQDYRCYVKEGVYYAPEKIREFKRSDNEFLLRKQAIFSLGMTLLHAAQLLPVNDCYNYQSCEFLQEKLEKHIEQLVSARPLDQSENNNGDCQNHTQRGGRYSDEFIQMLAMILEPNPNKRASIMEVHGILNKVWNSETEQQNTKKLDQENEQQDEQHEQEKKHMLNQTQSMQNQSTLKASNRIIGQQSNKKQMNKNAETRQPSEAGNFDNQNYVHPQVQENLNQRVRLGTGIQATEKTAAPNFGTLDRQSKPNVEYNSQNPTAVIHGNKFMVKPTESIPEILRSNQYNSTGPGAPLASAKGTTPVSIFSTPGGTSYINPPFNPIVNTSSFLYHGSSTNNLVGSNYPIGGGLKQNSSSLYTDPKLLQMIRKDLQDLNELKKSSMINAYGPSYSNNYIGSSSYYPSYTDIGPIGTGNMLSSKSSLGLTTNMGGLSNANNVQQVYTVYTETNYQNIKMEKPVTGNGQMKRIQTINKTETSVQPQQPVKSQSQSQIKPQPQSQPQSKSQARPSEPQKQPFQPTATANANIKTQTAKDEFVTEQYEDGRRYQGAVQNGYKHGQGKLTYSDGAYYEGHFVQDKMEGRGTLFYGPQRPAYQGDWVADQFHGRGILYNESPIQLNGCFNYSDFNLIEDYWVRYQGNFDSDNKSGEGKLVLSNGQQFIGQFENDAINGKGLFVTKDGDQIVGIWEENVLIQIEE